MWPFSIKKKGKRSIEENNQPDLRQLIDREHIQELDKDEAELRIWLPELCKQALDETIEYHSTTGARYLREFFVVYLYGEHELLRMREKETGLYFIPHPKPEPEEHYSGPMFSRLPVVKAVPGLGKNIIPIKLFLPEAIKDDLQELAEKVGIPLSTFVREILISRLLGHTLWAERLRSWSPQEEDIGNKWEAGTVEEQNMREDTPDDRELCRYDY